ncbi:hypothetical protein DXG01_006919 [Tephrocybe rancida]|nr:hypothetical protein DXG01_006919 [Tephrocybe rancida]
MLELLDLPPEIVVRVLCFLDTTDLPSISRTHSSLYAFFKSSKRLQYRVAALIAGVEVNPYSNHVSWERLFALQRLEKGWSNLTIDFRTKVPVEHSASGLYDLTGGICILGDMSKQILHYFNLPSKPDDSVAWSRINIGRRMVDFGLAIHEHDLIAVLTVTPHSTNLGRFVLEIRLFQFSTGKPHPLARTPVQFVHDTSRPEIATLIEIVGDYLVLVITHTVHHLLVRDCMYVFQWKTGTVTMNVSESKIPMPNIPWGHIPISDDYIEPIDYSSDDPHPMNPFMSIALPSISNSHTLFSTSCRAEPNPTPTGTPHSSQPSHPIHGDAIVILTFRVLDRMTGTIETLIMFVHRHELLKLCTDLHPDHSPSSVMTQTPVVMPWETWGPEHTRWFEVSSASASWITTTAGQRCVIASEPEEGAEQTVTVLDFNPRTVKRLLKEGFKDDGVRSLVVQESNVGNGVFNEPVKSVLPYVSVTRHLESTSNFRGVLLDEERLLGIKVGPEHTITEIEVLHVSMPCAGNGGEAIDP